MDSIDEVGGGVERPSTGRRAARRVLIVVTAVAVAAASAVTLRSRQPEQTVAVSQPSVTTATTPPTTTPSTTEVTQTPATTEAPTSTTAVPDMAPPVRTAQWPLPSNADDLVERSLMIVGTNGTGLRLVAHTDQVTVDISPDGSRLAYFSNGELRVIDIDGNNNRGFSGLPPTKNFHPPLWSPDGSAVAAVAAIPGTVHYQVWVAELSGEVRLISDGIGSVNGVAWSPDSTTVAVTTGAELLLLPRIPGSARKLLDLGGDTAWTLAYSPNGQMLAYAAANRGAGSWRDRLFVLNADGSDHRVVTDLDVVANAFAWSPDSTALMHKPVGKVGLVTTPLDGSPPIPMLSEAAQRPLWSSKNQVLFSTPGSPRPSRFEIMNADGSGRRTLVDDGSRPWLTDDFIVSPGGDFLAFTVAAAPNVAP